MPDWLSPFVKTGWLGVDLFFFLSGFVLLLPYAKVFFNKEKMPHLKDFILKRFLKIVPSYYLCLFILSVFHLNFPFSEPATLKDLVTHLFFIHNVFNETHDKFIVVLLTLMGCET